MFLFRFFYGRFDTMIPLSVPEISPCDGEQKELGILVVDSFHGNILIIFMTRMTMLMTMRMMMMVIADLPSTSQSSQLSSSNLDSRRSRTQSSGTSDHDHKHNEDDDDEKYDDDEDDDDDTDIVEALGDEGNVRSKLLLILLHPSLAKELPAFVFVFFALLFVSVFLYLSHLI